MSEPEPGKSESSKPEPGKPNEITFNPDAPDRDTYVKIRKMHLESGWIGQIIGSSKSAPLNIAGFSIGTMILAGLVLPFISSKVSVEEFWKIIAPMITMVLGYVFGKDGKK